MNTIKPKLSNHLKKIRMQTFMMNKKEFATFLELPWNQYYRYEEGLSLPSLEIAFYISQKLSCSIHDIWEIEKGD
jgi:DNA-binding XRE family transcriptional regulator